MHHHYYASLHRAIFNFQSKMQGYCMPLEEEEHHGNAVLSAVGTTTGGRGKNTITPPSKSIMQASAQVDA
jgi:hypothetical protein